jgi:hypothetical protein
MEKWCVCHAPNYIEMKVVFNLKVYQQLTVMEILFFRDILGTVI